MDHTAFKSLCQSVKEGNEDAIKEMLNMFEPLLYKHSIIDGAFDEDCYQELRIKLIECINKFSLNNNENRKEYLEDGWSK